MAPSMIGQYGAWAAQIAGPEPPALSFRRPTFTDVDAWRPAARKRLLERLAPPNLEPPVFDPRTATVHRRFTFDGLLVEELSWQLPHGPRTAAWLLKPADATGPLPGVVGLHDHGGQKFFGRDKITRVTGDQHPVMTAHQADYYGGRAWANELAKRGYVVLVHDAFAFASRRVRLAHMPDFLRDGLEDRDLSDGPVDADYIAAYNRWAAGHEHLMAKSLFSAGTTWPGVVLAEDQAAVSVLAARDDVDPDRIGCGGLSGGGLRTVYLAGADQRIRCAVCVGMMTTWRDYLLNKCHTHTWMVYTPLLPRELDYPEILGLHAPGAALVLNNREDPLFTLPEMERADAILAEVYAKAGAADRYRCTFYPGPHKFDQAMQEEAFAWFDRWLKP
ncbi:MAG: hypothetical protein D6790_01645, partial [Caldilineae bacterium]